MLRLRQICLVAPELTKSVAQLESILGLNTCFHDPGVEKYGLNNALLPIGTNFLEVVAPFQNGTTAQRYMDRRGGSGGYMVIMQCDDVEKRRHRMAELNIRVINNIDIEHAQFTSIQMHPKDTGGAIMETGTDNRGGQFDGPWGPAGDNWESCVQTEIVSALTGAELQSKNPKALAVRWAEVLDVPLGSTAHANHRLQLENATLRFTDIQDKRGEGLRSLDIKTADREELMRRATILGCGVNDNTVLINGIYFNLL